MEKDEMTVDPAFGYKIRPTDNGLKEWDFEAPQTITMLELDDDGLPPFFGDLKEAMNDGDC